MKLEAAAAGGGNDIAAAWNSSVTRQPAMCYLPFGSGALREVR